MAFFLNEPPPEHENPGTAEAQPHSAKSRPLFKQDTGLPDALAGTHISLSAYISKHLGRQEEPTEAANRPGVGNKPPVTPGSEPAQKPGREGQYLNSLDVELAAGLEQYLPTPLFRLRVMKKRLDGEINELKMRLQKYERLPLQSKDMQERIDAVKDRLAMLEAHNRQVSQDLQTALTYGPILYELSRQQQKISGWFAGVGAWMGQQFIRLLYGKAYQDLAASQADMRAMQELLAERMNDKHLSGLEISQIMNRYEQAAQQLETATIRFKSVSFPQRVWQEVRRLVE